MKRVILVALVALVILTAFHAPRKAGQQQYVASVLLQQGTSEGRISISVVNLGPSKKYPTAIFDRGVRLTDGYRSIGIRADAVLERQARTFQVFRLANIEMVKGGRVIRVAHLKIGLMTGDYNHPLWLCVAPYAILADCLTQWER